MKMRLFVVALFVAVVGLSSCSGGGDKSSENQIASFTVGTVAYTDINHTAGTIMYTYPKTGENVWTGRPTDWPNVTPTIVLKDTKASYSPTGPVNLSNPVIYTVTAENGDKKTYTVTVTLGNL